MRLILISLLFLGVFSCKNRNISKNEAVKSIDLNNSTWYIINQYGPGKNSSENMNFKISFGNGNYTLQLDPNSCNGTYSTDGNILKFSENISCTKVCCEKKEGEMLKGVLNTNFNMELKDSMLILKNEMVTLELSSSAPAKKISFNGKKYEVVKFMNMGNEIKPKFKYVIDFNDNMMNIQLDANSCFTEYSISNDNISFDGTMSCTERCCDSDESIKIKSFLSGRMMYLFEEENLVIFSKTGRIWLKPMESKIMPVQKPDASSLIGKTYKIYDVIKIPQGPEAVGAISVKYKFDYLLSFSQNGYSLKLDVNNCNGSAKYNESGVEFNSPGCTKMCCDSKESSEVRNYFKGRFELQQEGSLMTLDNSMVKIRLEEIK